MEPDIENMTLDEYREYETEKERRLWDNVRSKISPTRYKGVEFNSSHRDKSVTLDFPHYYEDALIENYYALSPLLLVSNLPSHILNVDVDLEKEEAKVKDDDDDGDTYDI
ncbi:hypothetical protein Tco_0173343 [Tanacetum coccineum]